jgi:hypothetical protein
VCADVVHTHASARHPPLQVQHNSATHQSCTPTRHHGAHSCKCQTSNSHCSTSAPHTFADHALLHAIMVCAPAGIHYSRCCAAGAAVIEHHTVPHAHRSCSALQSSHLKHIILALLHAVVVCGDVVHSHASARHPPLQVQHNNATHRSCKYTQQQLQSQHISATCTHRSCTPARHRGVC